MIDKLHELIDARPELVHARGGDGQTPLHVAFSVAIAEFLLDRGAAIDARDVDHESTPAQYLVRSHPEIVRFLIARGCRTDILLASAAGDTALVRRHLDADPESIRTRVTAQYFPMQNPHAGGSIYIWTLGKNRGPLQVAREFGHGEVLQLLLERAPGDLRLADACLAADTAAVQALMTSSPETVHASARANPGFISDAAESNNAAAVHLMLECGWPLEGDGRHTPLHWACWHGNAEMALDLLRFHPPLEFPDADYHSTPLGWAIHASEHGWHPESGDYAGAVEALLSAGAHRPEKIAGTRAVQEVLRRAAEH
jgi:ankyrin repeat protein